MSAATDEWVRPPSDRTARLHDLWWGLALAVISLAAVELVRGATPGADMGRRGIESDPTQEIPAVLAVRSLTRSYGDTRVLDTCPSMSTPVASPDSLGPRRRQDHDHAHHHGRAGRPGCTARPARGPPVGPASCWTRWGSVTAPVTSWRPCRSATSSAFQISAALVHRPTALVLDEP